MKKMTILKSIATLVLLVLVGMNLSAQVTGIGTLVQKSAAPQDVDYATVNSVMPYEVTPFSWGALASAMNPSVFKWAVTTGASGTDWYLYKNDGSTALPFVGSYSTESAITVKWLKTGDYTLNTTEKSQPKVGAGCEQATPENLTVHVIQWPNTVWGTFTDPSGCGLSGTINVPIVCRGSKTVTVKYTVVYTPLVGVATTTPLTATVSAGGYDQSNVALDLPVAVTAGNDGKYEISITDIYDELTEKSFGTLAAASPSRHGVVGTDYPAATSTKVFYSYPTPSTKPIQHIQNL